MSERPNDNFTVSVVIPAYNIGSYICRSIESVLSQKRPADEIIVVDDGSSDETAEKIKSYGDKVRYIYQENSGVSAARNSGITSATSTWIAFLDGDDEWMDEHLQMQMEVLEKNPELVWCSANYIRCLCDEKRRKADLPSSTIDRFKHSKEYFEDYIDAHIKGATGWTGTMMIKKTALEEAGMFTENLNRAEDMEMWFRIAFRSPRIGFISKPLAIYHLGISQSLSRQPAPAKDYCDLIWRLMELAKAENRLDAFEPCAAYLLRGWMRGMLFSARGSDIRQILEQFEKLFGPGYRILMRFLTVFPKLTAMGCHMVSRFVRVLRIRKELVRKPR